MTTLNRQPEWIEKVIYSLLLIVAFMIFFMCKSNSQSTLELQQQLQSEQTFQVQSVGDCGCEETPIQSQGFMTGLGDWGASIANITNMLLRNECDEFIKQKAERLRDKNNERKLKQLVKTRKKYENGKITFSEMLNHKASIKNISSAEAHAQEVENYRLSMQEISITLYKR